MITPNNNVRPAALANASEQETHSTLLPMLISGLVLIVIGMIGVMIFA